MTPVLADATPQWAADQKDRGLRKVTKFACLTYHAMGEPGDSYTISTIQFWEQLALLHRENYTVDGFEGLEQKLRSGDGFPARYAVLTVDDGYDSAMRAADLLQRYKYQASFFLIRDRAVSQPSYLREKDIRELRRAGFSVGTHGTTHRKLTFLPPEQCAAELAESKRWLEDVIGEEVRYMAAPGGFVNAGVMKAAYECGYTLVATCAESMNTPETMTLPGSVNRVNVRRQFSLQAFRHILAGHPGFYLYRQIRSALLWPAKQVLCR